MGSCTVLWLRSDVPGSDAIDCDLDLTVDEGGLFDSYYVWRAVARS